ncbi:unnamed protein product [Arabis nemorensis]|uniref:Uncharacterized protein n=1 Tax=Arabis nemorensis TaxID=586526 RepID=A0A565CDG3_9BRAS|nr:unnamed protein product [Arabis nemorensis]
MASQKNKNTVSDYMSQRKGGAPSRVSEMGARFIIPTTGRAQPPIPAPRTAESAPSGMGTLFISPTAGHVQIPIAAPRTRVSYTWDSSPLSSSETLSVNAEDDEDRVPETESWMTLEDLLLSPGRQNMLKLVPPSDNAQAESDAWFSLNHTVTGQIREIMEADFGGLYYNMTNTPLEVQRRWFKSFAQRFNWDIIHTEIIRKKFKTQAGTQLCGLVSDWKRGMKKPKFMGNTLWGKFLYHYRSEDHKATSDRNSKARKCNTSLQCTWKKSFIRRRHEMRDENGEFPSHVELLEDTHKRKLNGVVIDPMTVEILEKCNKKAEEVLSQKQACEDGSGQIQELTKDEMNALFKETVPIKRGRCYGMGSVSECIMGSLSFTPSPVITTLQTHLQSTQDEFHETKNV